MKKTFLLIAILLTLVSCQKENPVPGPDDEGRNCTIILIGCGGGNLDDYLIENLKQSYAIGSDENLGMTCLVKMSKAYKAKHDVGNFDGTVRFCLPAAMDTTKFDLFSQKTEKVGGDDFALYDAKNISDFIKWSVETLPAKNYILLLWNHGGGWNPKQDADETKATFAETKAILFDDNVDRKSLSLVSLQEAVLNSGIHFKAIHTDACLMALLENYTAYADMADYAIGSVEPTPNLGSRYDWILPIFRDFTDDASLETALKNYSDKICDYWDKNCPLDPKRDENEEITDFGYMNLRGIPVINGIFAKAVQEITVSWSKYGKEYIAAAQETPYFLSSYDFVDSRVFLSKAASRSGHAALITLADQYAAVLNTYSYRALVHPSYEQKPWREIYIGICLPTADKFKDSYDGKYQTLAFDKATSWSTLIPTLNKKTDK